MIATAGEPYAIHHKEDGSVEYEYIERFKVGGRDTEERHYFLLIKNGKVASKRVDQSRLLLISLTATKCRQPRPGDLIQNRGRGMRLCLMLHQRTPSSGLLLMSEDFRPLTLK